MTSSDKPLCTVPFTRAFVLSNGTYRDCCAAAPETKSQSTQSFISWWHGDQLKDIRQSMWSKKFPEACKSCEIQEQIHNTSFRLSANKEYSTLKNYHKVPDTWHILFGNKCNLACWTCDETSSSLIAHHKRQVNLLPENFVDPNNEFMRHWPDLKTSILDSYNHHEAIRISILGGEPMYNKRVIEFLELLISQGLSNRTSLEFTTNGTIIEKNLLKILERSQWNYICVFVSVDAVGRIAEWIRYGTVWKDVVENITQYSNAVDYVQIQTTLSILNLTALPDVVEFCEQRNLLHTTFMISDPEFMDLRKWDGEISMLNRQRFIDKNLHSYLDLVGSDKLIGTSEQLRSYIQQFSLLRRPLTEFDPALAKFFGL